ncbi:MAG: PilZ domain-containing protein [Candidatus Sumerlaeia bacterium]|nr:PilZ domain-containing protein [Candidatus Sumerlaeia bacterium]
MNGSQTIRCGDRQAVRFSVTLGAKITFPQPHRDDFIICRNGTIANLSEEGACVLLHSMSEEDVRLLKQAGQVCSVMCGFPDSNDACAFTARLVWIDSGNNSAQQGTALGLQFMEMDAAARRRLEDLFHRLTERR